MFRRNPRARRYVLRVAPDGTALVTIPRGGSEAWARRFVQEKEPWIRAQRERLAQHHAPITTWTPGSLVWFRGERHPILIDAHQARIGDLALPIPPPGTDWRHAIETHLRNLASRELPALVFATAQTHGLVVQRVQVRNQRSRWGSCSHRGTISLNWRLIQLPISVRDYLVAHELAHLRQMNHSQHFWAVVEAFFPNWREAERWLRQNGRQVLR